MSILLEEFFMTTEFELEQEIMKCIDDGLQPLGDSGQYVVYRYLENHFGLKREDIPKKPEIFRKGLILIFGEKGADIIEKWIIEKLKISFNLKQRSKITFAGAIAMIKAK